jgi:hypothetical protein
LARLSRRKSCVFHFTNLLSIFYWSDRKIVSH